MFETLNFRVLFQCKLVPLFLDILNALFAARALGILQEWQIGSKWWGKFVITKIPKAS